MIKRPVNSSLSPAAKRRGGADKLILFPAQGTCHKSHLI